MSNANIDPRINALLSELEKIIDKDESIPIIVPFLGAILSIIGFIVQLIILQPTNIPFTGNVIEVSRGYNSSSLLYTGLPFSIASFFAVIYLVYRWVNARNNHFTRTTKLYSIILEIAELLKFDKVDILRSRLNELIIINSSKKSIAINAILSAIIPFYILYVYHFMNRDFVNHSIKERLLLAELFDDIKKREVQFVRNIIEYEQVEIKSTFLYIILSIITAAIFTVYWAYSITKDYNNHIENHRLIDNDITSALKRIAS